MRKQEYLRYQGDGCYFWVDNVNGVFEVWYSTGTSEFFDEKFDILEDAIVQCDKNFDEYT